MKKFNFDSSKTLILENGDTIHQLIGQKKFVEHYNREGYFYDVSNVKSFRIADEGDGKNVLLFVYEDHRNEESVDCIELESFDNARLAKERLGYLVGVINDVPVK